MKKQRKAALFMAICMYLTLTGCSQAGLPSGGTGPDVKSRAETDFAHQSEPDFARQSEPDSNSRASVQADGRGVQQTSEPSDTRYHNVVVMSGPDIYLPYENFTFSNYTDTDAFGREQAVNACGRWLRAQDIESMPAVPYSGNMEIQAEGKLSRIMYGLYDETYEPKIGGDVEVNSISGISLPEEPEPYYVKLELSFEEENAVSGYQYFFQVLPDGSKKSRSESPGTDHAHTDGWRDSAIQ